MPGRVKGAWNLISKLAIVLIWKTPTHLKFGKTNFCQEQNILTFVYNKTGADSSEWFEPAEDAKNKKEKGSSKTKTKERSSSHQTTANTGVIQPSSSSKSRSGNNQVNPVVPNKNAASSSHGQVATSSAGKKQKKKATGAVYIMTMDACVTQPSPPFGKVGQTDRTASHCQARLRELQTGNPHRLRCVHMFLVTDPEEAESAAHSNMTKPPPNNLHLKSQRNCGTGKDWFLFPDGQTVQSLINRVRAVITDGGWFVSESSNNDWVESSINPSLSPNQSPQFLYNSKWRQLPCRGDELLHITYNCKWRFSEVTCVTIARSRKWSSKCRYSNKRRTFTENNFISAAVK